ncbi:MAG: helix-turn-helix transcriptional regulator [Oscillospiraceae bacterium]|nr:helix-turn-helix transcriptional regulator [Oscillospiraceae bacterium]
MFFINNPQEVAKTIKDEAKRQGLPVGKLLRDLGLSKNAISSMNAGYYPQLENLVKIADILGVSLDYLLGRSVPEKEKAPDIIRSRIADRVRGLSDHQADLLLAYLEGLLAESDADIPADK